MSDFDDVWSEAARYRHVSHSLKTLVYEVFTTADREPVDELALQSALDSLLQFLTSSRGRTDANCCVVDRFFSLLEGRWSHLPARLGTIVDGLAGTLHDSIYAPQVAALFETLPEQLLNRLRKP